MSLVLVFFSLVFSVLTCESQTFMSKTTFIGFYSKTPFEDIVAENQQVYAIVDTSKKQMAFSLLLKGFEFRKELMQTHFNENYVESDKYPKANFVGTFQGDLASRDTGNIEVRGNLTLHGVTKNLTIRATMKIINGRLSGETTFELLPQDFNISIPSLVKDKIAPQITVRVKMLAEAIKP